MTGLRRLPAWLAAVAVAVVIRVPLLGTRPLWYDEAFSLLLARRPTAEMLVGTAADTMPPAYYLLLQVWAQLGSSIGWMRFANVVLGAVLIGLAYLLGREVFDLRAARWGALLAALSPLLVYHAQEMRMYTLLGVALTGHVLCALIARRLPSGRRQVAAWGGATACGALALYTHNLAAFSLAALPAYALVRRDWRFLARLVLVLAAMGLLFLPWLFEVPGQIAKIQAAFWTPRPGPLEIVQTLVAFHTALPLPGAALGLGVGLSILAAALTVTTLVRRPTAGEGAGILLALIVAPALLLFAASFVMRPLFVPRALILPLVAYLVLAGKAIATAVPRAVGYGIAACFAGAAAIGLPSQFGHDTFPRAPFPEAVAFLESTGAEGDLVFHDNKLTFFPMIVYGPEMAQNFLADALGSHNDTLADDTRDALRLSPVADIALGVRGVRRVRYVVFQRALDEYADLGAAAPPAMAWLDGHGSLQARTAFNDLWIYDYLLDS